MKRGLFRDAVLVAAPCAAVVAGLASVDHHQRLVEAGYRVGALESERAALVLEVEHMRVRVANLSSPARLLAEARERNLPLDYPLHWNVVASGAEAARLVAPKPAPAAPTTASGKAAAPRGKKSRRP
ncbi:MAG TPA: hypothetical protein VFS92_01850 [Planctomycetota bacterium]|nr:hypothetical protein [Planctomycetota bacterium]